MGVRGLVAPSAEAIRKGVQLHSLGRRTFNDSLTSPGNLISANRAGYSIRKAMPNDATAKPELGMAIGPMAAVDLNLGGTNLDPRAAPAVAAGDNGTPGATTTDPKAVPAPAPAAVDNGTPAGATTTDPNTYQAPAAVGNGTPGSGPAADPNAGVNRLPTGATGATRPVPRQNGTAARPRLRPRRPAPPPPPTPAQLAARLVPQLNLPAPTGRQAPRLMIDGQQNTIVNAHTWYWIDPAIWKPVRHTLTAGPVTTTVTATPATLRVDPGDDSAAVSCGGSPGTERTREFGTHDVASPTSCEHIYRQTTDADQPVTATYTVGWQVTYTGRTAAGQPVTGNLAAPTTAATNQFAIVATHAVLVDPNGD